MCIFKFCFMWVVLVTCALLFQVLSCAKDVKVKKIDFICEECEKASDSNAAGKEDLGESISKDIQNPIIIEYESLKNELNVRTYEEMFEKALNFYSKGDIELAGKIFDVLAKNSPNQNYKEIALFNLAISLERMGNDVQAEKIYSELRKSNIYEIKADSYLRLARIKVSRGEEFSFEDGIIVDRERGSFVKALELLRETEGILSEVVTFTVPVGVKFSSRLVAIKREISELKASQKIPEVQSMLSLCQGNIKFIEAALVPNYPPKEVEKKAKLLIEAQKEYFSVVRSGEIWWVTAGVFKLGETYRYLFENLVYSQPPPELKTDEERAIYREELMKELRRALKWAKDIYEKNINFAERLKFKNIWVSKSEQELKKIKEYILQIEQLLSVNEDTEKAN